MRPAAALMAGRLAGAVVSFCIPVVLARVFDPAGFGAYKQMFLIYGTLFSIAQVGMAESLFYFLPSDPQRCGRYACNALLLLSASGTACCILLWAGRSPIAAWLGHEALSGPALLLGLHLALMLASAGLEIVLTARRRYAGAACAYAASDTLRTALFLVPVILEPRLEALLFGAVGFAALRLAATVVIMRRAFGAGLRPDGALLRRQLAYALPLQMYVVVETLQSNWHQYAVAHHFDAASFAIYSVGCLQVPLVDLAAGSTCNVMMVQMAESGAAGRSADALALWHDAVRKLALVFFPLVGLLLVGARDLIVLLFTERYLPSVPILMIWSAAFLLAALPVDGVLRARADTGFLLALGAGKLLLVMASAGWLIARFHLLGGVVVTLLSTVFGKILALWRIHRHLRARLPALLPWADLAAIALAASAAGVPALILSRGLDLPAGPSLLATGLLYAACYAGLIGARRLPRVRGAMAVSRGAER